VHKNKMTVLPDNTDTWANAQANAVQSVGKYGLFAESMHENKNIAVDVERYILINGCVSVA